MFIFYTDNYTKKIADTVRGEGDTLNFLKISNPTFSRWRLFFTPNRGDTKGYSMLPSNSVLIGGNRWRHHFALNLTDLPIIVVDAHSDMNYDEMILFHLIRPYNWLYYRLLKGLETHLILPYDTLQWGRWNIVIPPRYTDYFYLYSLKRKVPQVKVSLSIMKSVSVQIKDPFTSPPLSTLTKQISLDQDILREVSEDTLMTLLTHLFKKGDVCDIWLDEGRLGNRKTLQEHKDLCKNIVELFKTI